MLVAKHKAVNKYISYFSLVFVQVENILKGKHSILERRISTEGGVAFVNSYK